MSNLILHDARQIVTCAGRAPKRGAHMRDIGLLLHHSIIIERGIISEILPATHVLPKYSHRIDSGDYTIIDCSSDVLMPGFVDPHTHCLFTGTREDEFEMRIEGKTYVDILLGGGGILNTVHRVRAASDEELLASTLPRLDRMLRHGTTTCEIKSGYGLDLDSELAMLRSIARLNDRHAIDAVPTFMGAHAVPPEFADRLDEYTTLVTDVMLPRVAEQHLARYCDIFCERKVFPVEQSRRILERARELDFDLKAHVDEIEAIGGLELALELGATSVEHLIVATDEGIDVLARSPTIAILLPGTAFSLMHGTYARARRMIDKGVAVALATDCNPGSCYTESMQIVIAIACTQMKMVAAEAITATTINAAASIGLADRVGSLEPGKQADVVAFSIPDYKYIPYHFGVNHVRLVIKRGVVVVDTGQDGSVDVP